MTQADIMGLLGQYFPDARWDSEWISVKCPFHKGGMERKPSFRLHTVTGHGKCFTCVKTWNLRTLLKDLGMPADLVDKEVPESFLRSVRKEQDPTLTFPILPEALLGVYQHCPVYMLRHGYSMDILREYEVGYDKQRDRVVFPLRDHLCNFVGLMGKKLTEGGGKYKLYKEELRDIYSGYDLSKGTVMWNLHRFYGCALEKKLDYLVIVEGFKAALWLIQNGYPNTVALIGASPTEVQIDLLKRLNIGTIYISLDNDDAGTVGTIKAVKALRHVTDLKVILWDKHQPDDHDREQIALHVAGAIPWYKFMRQYNIITGGRYEYYDGPNRTYA